MLFGYFDYHFARINRKLDLILRLEGQIMADEAGLDQALADLSAGQDDLNAAVQSLIDKASQADVDLSDEIATIQGIQERQSAAKDQIEEAVGGGVTTEPPAEEPPA